MWDGKNCIVGPQEGFCRKPSVFSRQRDQASGKLCSFLDAVQMRFRAAPFLQGSLARKALLQAFF
jgi:hypothetical protein